jgi:hypothetical protein
LSRASSLPPILMSNLETSTWPCIAAACSGARPAHTERPSSQLEGATAGSLQGALTFEVPRVHICTLPDELPHSLDLPCRGGLVERRAARGRVLGFLGMRGGVRE